MAILGLLRKQRSDHPLADAKKAAPMLAALSSAPSEKALSDLGHWLESLADDQGLPPARRWELVLALDAAGASHARRHTMAYLDPTLPSFQKIRWWQIGHDYWHFLAAAYGAGLRELGEAPGGLAPDALAQFYARSIHAAHQGVVWSQWCYQPHSTLLWSLAGQAYAAAERDGCSQTGIRLYMADTENISPLQAYLQMLAFHALSMDCLRPLEMTLIHRLLGPVASALTLQSVSDERCAYWIRISADQPPARLVQMPSAHGDNRYFGLGPAQPVLQQMAAQVRKAGVPPQAWVQGLKIDLEQVLQVLDHALAHCAPVPPQRLFPRIEVNNRMLVVHDVSEICARLGQGEIRQEGAIWTANDVSRGGIGVQVALEEVRWVEVGMPVGVNPDGGDNWLLAQVKRFAKDSARQATVGLETLSHFPLPGRLFRGRLQSDVLLLDGPPVVGAVTRLLCRDVDWHAYATAILEHGESRVRVRPQSVESASGHCVIAQYRVEPEHYVCEGSDAAI